MVTLAGKTLYLLEELPQGKMASSKIKCIASQDSVSCRGLYKDQQLIQLCGKLLINANNPPDIGEEGAIWDRAIYIPWDTRYVHDGDEVDEENYRLPSDNNKKQYIVSLRCAFANVCLKELHRFLKPRIDKETGELGVSELPQPACVKDLLAHEKERAFPLKMFTKGYINEQDGYNELTVNHFFNAYRGFLRARNIRSQESLDDIVTKFVRVGLPSPVEDNTGLQFLPNCSMTDAGHLLADREAINMRVDVAVPRPIEQAFKRQRDA